MIDEAVQKTENELQAHLARKADLLEALEQVDKQIEQGRIILQVLKFAQQSKQEEAQLAETSATKQPVASKK